jgi:hypothetical protein
MDDLMQKLINAKKVMDKVQSGDFSHGNIDESLLQVDTDKALPYQGKMPIVESNEERPIAMPKVLPPDIYKSNVSKSKLPDAIKNAMLESQIVQPDIDFGSSITLEFAEKVNKQMEKQGMKPVPKKPVQQAKPFKQPIREEVDVDFEMGNVAPTSSRKPVSLNETLINEMKPLIKEIIQSTLEATIEKILTEKLAKHDKETLKINESLRIQVGDSVFVGKITGVKQQKK